MLSSIAGRIWFGGPVKLFADIVSTPDWTIKSFRKAGKIALPVLLAAIAIAAPASLLLKSSYVILITAIAIFLSYTSQTQGMWFLIISTAWSDFKRLFLTKKNINHGTASIFVLGLGIGLLIAYWIPFKPYGNFILAVICLSLIILYSKRKLNPKTLLLLISATVFNIIVWKIQSVYADDGGWQEAGGTFWSWWNSPGRAAAIAMGVPPSLASLLGSLLGGTQTPKPPPIPEVMDYNREDWRWVNENGKWVLYQTDKNGNKFGRGIPQSIFDTDPEFAGNMIRIYTQPTCNMTSFSDKMEQTMENFGRGYTDHFTRDGWQKMDNHQRSVVLEQLARQVADISGIDPNSFRVNMVRESPGSYGSWNASTRILEINQNCSSFNNPYEMILTVAHEMRHAAQCDPNLDLGGDKDYRNMISWNDRNENYQAAGTDFTRYSGQLLERDAENFGHAITRTIIRNAYNNR